MLCCCLVRVVEDKPRRGEARRSRTSSTSIRSNCSEEKKNTCFVKALYHANIFMTKNTTEKKKKK